MEEKACYENKNTQIGTMKEGNEINQRNTLSWEKICQLLAHQDQYPRTNQTKRLHLKILDTVFLHQRNGDQTCSRIQDWFLTTKKGIVTRRKHPNSLTLQHVYDRFRRFSLVNASNATGPRIIAVGYMRQNQNEPTDNFHDQVNYTDEQFQRMLIEDSSVRNCIYIQTYLRPYEGINYIFRGCFQIISDPLETTFAKNEHASDRNIEVLTKIVESSLLASDMKTSSFQSSSIMKWIEREVEVSTLKVVDHLERQMNNVLCQPLGDLNGSEGVSKSYNQRILTLTADFILDDNKHLWMTYIDNLTFSDKDDIATKINSISEYFNKENTTENRIVLPKVVSNESVEIVRDFKERMEQGNNKKLKILRNHNDCHKDVLQNKVSPVLLFFFSLRVI